MSRIDNALEEAVRLRESSTAASAVTADQPKAARVAPSSPYIVALDHPPSVVTEEYRKLKSMVMKLTRGNVFRNTLMVTSPDSGDGKSITSLNLAAMLAQDYNVSVVLVDADLRRPSLHGYLGLAPVKGLADCLTGGLDAEAAIVQSGYPKLSFLGSGQTVKDPVELLSSLRMKKLIAEMKLRYKDRYIIIDTPPVLPFAETQALGAMVDGIVVVVKEGRTTNKGLRDTLDILRDAPLLGVVLNDASPMNLNNRYRHYQHYYVRTADAAKQAG